MKSTLAPLALLLLVGCATLHAFPVWTGGSTAPVLQADAGAFMDGNYALLVLGEQIRGDGGAAATLVALQCGGHKLPLHGVSDRGVSPQAFMAVPKATYVLADDTGHAYRVWQIPLEGATRKKCEGAPFSLFVAEVQEGGAWMGQYRTYGMGDLQVIPVEVAGGHDDFQGSTFQVDEPGIYYLGEVHVMADLGTYTNSSTGASRLPVEVRPSADLPRLEGWLQAHGLGDVALHDVSDRWRELPRADAVKFVKGKL